MGDKSKSRGGCCGWFLAFIVLAIVVGAIAYVVVKKIGHSHKHGSLGPDEDYASALKLAMQFFDIQKCNVKCFSLSFLSLSFSI